MALAMVYPEPEKGGRGNKLNSSESEEFSNTKPVYLSMARLVVRHVPEHCQAVLQGESLNDAYEKAKDKRDERDVEAEEIVREKADRRDRITKLGLNYPELAQNVEEGKFGLEAMEAEAEGRDISAQHQKDAILNDYIGLRKILIPIATDSYAKELPDLLGDDEFCYRLLQKFREYGEPDDDLSEVFKQMSKGLTRVSETMVKLDEGCGAV